MGIGGDDDATKRSRASGPDPAQNPCTTTLLILITVILLSNNAKMVRPWSGECNHVGLFMTSSVPFLPSWISDICTQARNGDEWTDGPPYNTLVPIPGDFVGWTPQRIAVEYVLPNFGGYVSLFAGISFVVADNRTHFDKKLLIVGLLPRCFGSGLVRGDDGRGDPNVVIEGMVRLEPMFALSLPLIFNNGDQGITAYGPQEDEYQDVEGPSTDE